MPRIFPSLYKTGVRMYFSGIPKYNNSACFAFLKSNLIFSPNCTLNFETLKFCTKEVIVGSFIKLSLLFFLHDKIVIKITTTNDRNFNLFF